MSDIVLERQTYILVASPEDRMFPADDLYPSDDLYPADMDRVSNIVAGTMQISEILCDRELSFGQLYATKFEVQVYDTEDLSGNYIVVIQEENNQSKIVFTGIIDSCKQDRLGYDRTIVAYDLAYSKSYMNVATWWENFWDNRAIATLKQLRESLLTYAGIKYEDVELINDTIPFTKSVSVTSMPFGTMLKMICELSCCFPHFTRKGMMEFIVLNDEEPVLLQDSDYEGENSTFEEYTTSAITGVQFYSSSGSIIHTEGTSINPYSVSNNLLVFNLSAQELATIGDAMLDYISELVYTPANIKMIIGTFTYKLGDYITTNNGNFYLLKNEYSGSQFVEQQLIAGGNESREQVGVEFNAPEAVIAETVDNLDEGVEDLYEYESDSQYYEEAIQEDYEEEQRKHIEEGDDYVESIVASTTGQEVWDTSGYNFNDDNSGYGAPTAEYDSTPVWSNQGYTIADIVYGTPRGSDYDVSDVGKYYLNEKNGTIWQLKDYGYNEGARVLLMKPIANGVADSYTYDWNIYPDVQVGGYYLDCEEGKIYQLTQNGQLYEWTLVKQCGKITVQLSTRITQTEEDIELQAERSDGLEASINVNAQNIALKVSKNDVINQINISNESITIDGAKINISGNTTFTATQSTANSAYNTANSASSSVSSLSNGLSTGTTTINGGCIETGTLSADKITSGTMSAGSYLSVGGTSNTTIRYNMIETGNIAPGSNFSTLGVGANGSNLSLIGSEVRFNVGGYLRGYWDSTGLSVPKLQVTEPASTTSSANVRFSSSSSGFLRYVSSGSSQRWKNSITINISEEIDPKKLYDLDVVEYKYNTDYLDNVLDRRYDQKLVGFIAEDVASVYPNACDFDENGFPSGWNSHYIIPPMLALIQEQNKRIEVLENKITQLEGGS